MISEQNRRLDNRSARSRSSRWPLLAGPTVLGSVAALALVASGTATSTPWVLASRPLQRPAQSLGSSARSTSSGEAPAGQGLHRVRPAPKTAEISIGLLPTGNQYPYTYLGHDADEVWYGPSGASRSRPDPVTDIVLSVRRLTGNAKDFRLVVKGKPARYSTSAGYTTVRVRWSRHVVVGFQVPPNSTVGRRPALRMASTLDVRSTKHRVHG